MKKQKKLNLGKIKIAGINNTHALFGGATTQCPTGQNDPGEPTCNCTQDPGPCGESTPAQTCGTLQTVADTDDCEDTRNNGVPNL